MLSRLGPFLIPDTTWLNHWQPIRQPILIVRRSLPPKIENKFLWDKIKFSIFNNILQRAQATTQHRTTTTSVVRRPLYNVSVTKTFSETFIKIVQKCFKTAKIKSEQNNFLRRNTLCHTFKSKKKNYYFRCESKTKPSFFWRC